MEDQYGISDLRQYINGRTIFQPISQQPPPDLLSGHSNLSPLLVQQYPPEINLVGRQMSNPPSGFLHPDFRTDSSVATGVSVSCGLSSTGACFSGLDIDGGGGFVATGGGDCGTGRWPRQETLTLLEIRSRLDSKFKEANHKGPLWDEVSRIMSEEHGYQRSGKKCREKFENLYKYYKKTKDGKAGRQDGKHYRFFRQLEALYGESSNIGSSFSGNHLIGSSNFKCHNASMAANNTNTILVSNQEALQASKIDDSLSLSNSSDFYSTSSEDATVENDSSDKRRKKKGKKNWKVKIKDFVDSQMRKLMEKQEIWLEKMMSNIEEKEQERIRREDEWKKQEADRIEREQKYWANERAWIEARDASFMDCIRKITGKEVKPTYPPHQELLVPSREHEHPTMINNESHSDTRLLESTSITEYLTKSITKKRKEDSRAFGNYLTNESISMGNEGSYSYGGNDQWLGTLRHGHSEQRGNSPPDDGGTGSAMPYGGYRYLLGDAGNLWENYGVKFNKGEGENQ